MINVQKKKVSSSSSSHNKCPDDSYESYENVWHCWTFNSCCCCCSPFSIHHFFHFYYREAYRLFLQIILIKFTVMGWDCTNLHCNVDCTDFHIFQLLWLRFFCPDDFLRKRSIPNQLISKKTRKASDRLDNCDLSSDKETVVVWSMKVLQHRIKSESNANRLFLIESIRTE